AFNGAVPGVSAAGIGVLARVLAGIARPSVVVYAFTPAEFAPSAGGELGGRLHAVPGVRYRLGQPTLEGWLADSSSAYRLFLGYRTWRHPGPLRALEYQGRRLAASPYGFLPVDPVATDVGRAPDPGVEPGPAAAWRYELSPDALRGL